MHVLIGYLLEGEGNKADPFIIKECLDPVRARDFECRVKANGNVAMPLGLIKEGKLCLGLRDDLFPVRSQEPDLDHEFSLTTCPFVDYGEAVMESRERVRIDAFKEPHEAEFAAHFLTHIIAEERVT